MSTASRFESSRSSLRYGSFPSIGPNKPVLEEHQLLSTLFAELKRTERSGLPFLLILVDGGEVFQNTTRSGARQGAIAALQAAIRDTDMIGWYRHDAVLAAILPEVSDKGRAVEAILTRLSDSLDFSVGPAAARISITHHTYPEKPAGLEPHAALKLCPELLPPPPPKPLFRALKRALDVTISMAALFLLSPVLILVAAAIKATSRGPVLFRQVRVGRDLKRFTFLKFRSMYHGSSAQPHQAYVTSFINGNQPAGNRPNGAVYKLTNDSRVTSVGRFLRQTSLDELPQLFNVLLGDMSLVGPRPPLPYELEQYKKWHRRRLLHIKPGITGLWQVSGRSRTTFDEMVRLDLDYIDRASLWMDIKILMQTPRAVFSREGAW